MRVGADRLSKCCGTEADQGGLSRFLATTMIYMISQSCTLAFALALLIIPAIGLADEPTILTGTYTSQMEALRKYRNGGEQKVTVEHVNVHEGGQAIVGNVQGGGGANDK